MRPVRIFVDSTADIPSEIMKKYNITLMPLYVTLGDTTYKDVVEVNASDIFDYCEKNKTLPKTAAVSVSDYLDAFGPVVEEGSDIVHFTICSDMSSCYQNACLAAEQLGHIRVVDSRNLSSGIGLLAIAASEMAAAGKSSDEIFDEITSMIPQLDVSFVLNDLNYLYKGGRCSGVAALGANVLKLKPCIEVVNGKMGVGKKYRGSFEKCVHEYIKDRLEGKTNIDTHRMFFTYTAVDPSIVAALKKEIASYQPFEELLLSEAGSTISGHCGPCCLGILYLHKI